MSLAPIDDLMHVVEVLIVVLKGCLQLNIKQVSFIILKLNLFVKVQNLVFYLLFWNSVATFLLF